MNVLQRVSINLIGLLLFSPLIGFLNAENITLPLHRIFLQGGTHLVIVSDYVRIGDKVVFAVPFSTVPNDTNPQLVSLPEAFVDWTTTQRYTDAVRASLFTATRGEQEYQAINAQVARVLNEIAVTNNSDLRLSLARDVRKQLLDWTATSYGYRSSDVREILALLEEAIVLESGSSYKLDLVAGTSRTDMVPLLPPPNIKDILEKALLVSELTDVPAEKLSILRAILYEVNENRHSNKFDVGWRESFHKKVEKRLSQEMDIERFYASLKIESLRRASNYAKNADVRNVQMVLDEVIRTDREFGGQRPVEVLALSRRIEEYLTEARHIRLENDSWKFKVTTFRTYNSELQYLIDNFLDLRPLIEDIRVLAGPEVSVLPEVGDQLSVATDILSRYDPADEVKSVHDLIRKAFTLATSAAHGRLEAVRDVDLATAWDSAAAAAGAIMFFDLAMSELNQVITEPL
tara:strand:- start:1257 stop:2639 length:1383 start_codon:yes stop_codon:yes gene_type:complete